jgi:hypothetical protein
MPTPTGQGPQVLTLAVVRQDYCAFCCDTSCAQIPTPTPFYDAQMRRIFPVVGGYAFVIVVEAAPGLSAATAGTSLKPEPDSGRPDLQIQNNRDMGSNPTALVCDTGPASHGGGGIPGINPPSFSEQNQMISDALNDFACRFQAFSAAAPCTKTDATQDPKLLSPGAPPSTVQFCDLVASVAAFPPGDSILTVKVRDVNGNLGPAKQIVIRVPTPKP